MQRLLGRTGAVLFFAIFATLSSTAAARAAQNAHPFQLVLGAFFPSSSDAQDFAHSEFLIDGIYDLNHPTSAHNPFISGYIGYAGGSNGSASQGNFWVGAQVRTPGPFYVGGGTGYYNSWGTVNLGGGTTVTSSAGGIGGVLFLGGDFGKSGSGLGLRAGYDFLPSWSGVNPSGWEAALTYRF